MKLSYTKIATYGNEIHSTANNMKDILDDIRNSSHTLARSGSWTGQASDYYINKMEKLISNFDDVYNELESSVLFLAKVSEGYDALDKMVMQEICTNLNITEANLNSSKIFS